MNDRIRGSETFDMTIMVPLIRDSQIALVAVAIVFGTIATAAVCLRLLAARMSSRRLDASDYSILVAWLLTMGLMVTCILGMCYMSYLIFILLRFFFFST